MVQTPSYYEAPQDCPPVPEFASKLQIKVDTLFGWLKVK